MPPRVKRRSYDASRRRAAAAARRHAILVAANNLFIELGYAATTMQAIADAAGVALDTVYDLVGRKADLFGLLLETAISGADEAIPAERREYVRMIRAEPDARRKLAIYAQAIADIAPRLGPLFRVAHEAAGTDPAIATQADGLAQRRARNMRLLAADLMVTGAVRSDLAVEDVADVIWSMNAPEYTMLLIRDLGWSREKLAGWLTDAWQRLLLSPAGASQSEARAQQ
jgi:AcrR family transcriptional regulator